MLVVGLYDGNIAVYNLQKNLGGPNYQSDAKNGKHRDIVWQVRWGTKVPSLSGAKAAGIIARLRDDYWGPRQSRTKVKLMW